MELMRKTKYPWRISISLQSFEDFKGQEKLVGEKGIIYKILQGGNFVNAIFWGPPRDG